MVFAATSMHIKSESNSSGSRNLERVKLSRREFQPTLIRSSRILVAPCNQCIQVSQRLKSSSCSPMRKGKKSVAFVQCYQSRLSTSMPSSSVMSKCAICSTRAFVSLARYASLFPSSWLEDAHHLLALGRGLGIDETYGTLLDSVVCFGYPYWPKWLGSGQTRGRSEPDSRSHVSVTCHVNSEKELSRARSMVGGEPVLAQPFRCNLLSPCSHSSPEIDVVGVPEGLVPLLVAVRVPLRVLVPLIHHVDSCMLVIPSSSSKMDWQCTSSKLPPNEM